EHPFTRKLVAPLFGFAPNSQGYNDVEFAREKRSGITRIAAVGDSFFVAQVPRPQGVIARAAQLLTGTGARAELYDFGIVASDLDAYQIILEQDALAYHPDLVLLGVYVGNDLRISASATALHYGAYALDRAFDDVRRRLAAHRL